MTQSQPEVREPDFFSRLTGDSTVMIAVISLWLYIVTSSFLTGYLKTFGCRPEWFEPSVFQLVTFIGLALMAWGFANTLGAAWGGMTFNTPPQFSALAADDPTRGIEVLFSDGTRTLTRESTPEGVRLFYRNPSANQVWSLTQAG